MVQGRAGETRNTDQQMIARLRAARAVIFTDSTRDLDKSVTFRHPSTAVVISQKNGQTASLFTGIPALKEERERVRRGGIIENVLVSKSFQSPIMETTIVKPAVKHFKPLTKFAKIFSKFCSVPLKCSPFKIGLHNSALLSPSAFCTSLYILLLLISSIQTDPRRCSSPWFLPTSCTGVLGVTRTRSATRACRPWSWSVIVVNSGLLLQLAPICDAFLLLRFISLRGLAFACHPSFSALSAAARASASNVPASQCTPIPPQPRAHPPLPPRPSPHTTSKHPPPGSAPPSASSSAFVKQQQRGLPLALYVQRRASS
ncbi:hypothetical protein B0H11DRAFT_2405769 [Mycena galericulata]|nr:hypothetical protein B0H11DRAFT_2405769 [Mycena galericulata]